MYMKTKIIIGAIGVLSLGATIGFTQVGQGGQHAAAKDGNAQHQAGAKMGQHGGGGGHHGMMVGATLLQRPDVLAELSLNEDQTEALGTLLQHVREMAMAGQEGHAAKSEGHEAKAEGHAATGDATHDGQKAMQDRMQRFNAALGEIFTESQFKRFHQLTGQWQGPIAVANPHVAEMLGLSEAQIAQIHEVQADHQKSMAARSEALDSAGPAPAMSREEMAKVRKEIGKHILNVLTSDQRAQWKKMLGKPFDFKRDEAA